MCTRINGHNVVTRNVTVSEAQQAETGWNVLPAFCTSKATSWRASARSQELVAEMKGTFKFLSSWLLPFLWSQIKAAKQRAWLGPSDFVEGSPPFLRNSHGFASVDDKLFVFGGYLGNG